MQKNNLILIIGSIFTCIFLYGLSFDISYADDPFATGVCCDANAINKVDPNPANNEVCGPANYYCIYQPPITDICCNDNAINNTPDWLKAVLAPTQCHSDSPWCYFLTPVCSIEGDPNYRDVINGETEEYSSATPPCTAVAGPSCTVTAVFEKLTTSGVKVSGNALRTFNSSCSSVDQTVASNAIKNIAAAASSESTPLNLYQNAGGVVLYRVTDKDYCPYQQIPGDDTEVPTGYEKDSNFNCVLNCEAIQQIPSSTGYGCMEPTVATCGSATSTGPLSYSPVSSLCEHGSPSPTPVNTGTSTYSWTCTDNNAILGTTTTGCFVAMDTSCTNDSCNDLCPNIGGSQNQYYLDNHIPPMYVSTYIQNNPINCVPIYVQQCTWNESTQSNDCVDVQTGQTCEDNYQTLTRCDAREDGDLCLNIDGIQNNTYIATHSMTRNQYGKCWSDTTGSCGPAINNPTLTTPLAGSDGFNLCLQGSTNTDPVTLNESTNKYEWGCTTSTQDATVSTCSVDKGCNTDQKECGGICINKTNMCNGTCDITTQKACNGLCIDKSSTCANGDGSGGNGKTKTSTLINSFNMSPTIISTSTDPDKYCGLSWSSGIDPQSSDDGCKLNGSPVSGTFTGYHASIGSYTLECYTSTTTQSKVARCELNPYFKEI